MGPTVVSVATPRRAMHNSISIFARATPSGAFATSKPCLTSLPPPGSRSPKSSRCRPTTSVWFLCAVLPQRHGPIARSHALHPRTTAHGEPSLLLLPHARDGDRHSDHGRAERSAGRAVREPGLRGVDPVFRGAGHLGCFPFCRG